MLQVLSDSTEADPTSDGAFRGEQLLVVEVTSGRYEGEMLQAYNFVGPLYGVPVKAGDTVTLGQTVGYVANSALLETAIGDHLHFCVTHQDKTVDPGEFVKLS